MKNILDITNLYFNALNNKEINTLSKIYSKNINLIDWDLCISGKNKVLEANIQLFKNKFRIDVLSSNEIKHKTFNEIILKINNVSLNIIDIITFDENLKINEIKAFKR